MNQLNTRRRLGIFLAASLLCSFTLGCSGNSAPSAPSQASTPAPASQAASQPQPAATGEKVLHVSRSYEQNYPMDPHTWPGFATVMYGMNSFETLVSFDDDLNYVPRLAESWETSDDGLTYTFKLRQGVQFHYDYGELKASDVVFSFERLRDPELKISYLTAKVNLDNIAQITALDDYTVEFVLKEFDLTFLYRLAATNMVIVSEKAVSDLGNEGFGKKPVGTGPYYFVRGLAGESTEIARFNQYWGEKAGLDKIIFHIISEPATQFNSFQAGEIDFFEIVDVQKILEYKGQPDRYTVDTVPSSQHCIVGMNDSIEPFNDIRVRQAVAYAIDRQEICDNYFMGLESPPTSILPDNNVKYITKNNFTPEYDPEKAKALLAEAGYPNGFDTEFWSPNDQVSVGPATVIQTYLTAVGIRAQLQAVDFGVFMDNAKGGKCPMWLFYNGPGIIPDQYFNAFTSAKAPGDNYSMWKDPEYDEYVALAMAAKDEESKADFYAKAQERLVAELPFIPIASYMQTHVMHAKVKGFKLNSYRQASFEGVYWEE